MKRLLLVVLTLLLAFYVAWPVWSALQLRNALKAEDAATVERKIDFPSVRSSMRPAVTQKVTEVYDRIIQQSAPGTALLATQLKAQVLPQIVETTLGVVVTPANVIRFANDAGPIKERIERIVRETMGKVSGLPQGTGGPSPVTTVPTTAGGVQPTGGKPAGGNGDKQGLTLANVKRVAMTGPLSFEVGLAKDPDAATADVTAQMGFTGLDWKLIGLVPRS